MVATSSDFEQAAAAPLPGPPDAAAPPDLDARATFLAMQVVEGHFEQVTGTHMHWLYRELSKNIHRDFALSAREEALASGGGSEAGMGSGGRRRRGGRGGRGVPKAPENSMPET